MFIRTVLLVLLSITAYAQEMSVSGFVLERLSGESVVSAVVKSKASDEFVFTNSEGFFAINTVASDTLIVSSVGFESLDIILGEADTLINIRLDYSSNLLEAVEVKSNRILDRQVVGLTSLNSKQIKAIPTLLGEADVLKAFLFTPGVAMVNELSSGFSVRGGKPSQNLILLDGTVVYNQAHLFGLTSNFNPDLVKEAKLYKSYFPSKYGGRASSVLDVTLKEGNSSRIKQELSIGMINSRYIIEGPLNKLDREKTTFSLGLRSSYLTLFLLPGKFSDKKLANSEYFNYWLYDISGKIKHSINDKTKLYFGIYHGNDFWETITGVRANMSRFNVSWGNFTMTTRLAYAANSRLFLNAQVSSTNYRHTLQLSFEDEEGSLPDLRIRSKVNDIDFKLYGDWFMTNSSLVQFGLNVTDHSFTPSKAENIELNNEKSRLIKAQEFVAFTSVEQQIDKKNQIDAGLRFVSFHTQSETFFKLEPRVALRRSLKKGSQLYLTYNRMNQFIHQVSSNSLAFPIDIWIPSSEDIAPEQMDQIDIGWVKEEVGDFNSVRLNLFYKNYSNVLEFQQGVSLLTDIDQSPAELVEKNGKGFSYGAEVGAEYSLGTFNYGMTYTYSVSRLLFDVINNGEWFFSNFDRPHNVTIHGAKSWKEGNISLSTNWVFFSGASVSIPTKVINSFTNGAHGYSPYLLYLNKNNYRLPNYHRLDLSLSFKKLTKRFRPRTLSFGVYNAYNKFNAMYVDISFRTNGADSYQNVEFKKGAVLPILPFVNYTIGL